MSERIYTRREISLASGVKEKTIYSRYTERVKRGEMPPKLKYHTYEEVKELLRLKRPVARGANMANVNALKLKLKNDGFRIAKEEAK